MEILNSPKLIIITGPSGAGKGTIIEELMNKKELNLSYSISATTRPKRELEIDGINYFFLTKEQFDKKIANDEFLEYEIYANNKYGTLKKQIEELIKEGKNVILEIEVKGALNIMEKYPNATSIFILPPSIEELKKRLLKRKTESKDIITTRLKIAEFELSKFKRFKYNVVNIDFNNTIEKIVEILKKALLTDIDDNW